MKFKAQLLGITVMCMLMMSCEREIDFNLKAKDPKLVVEGFIENNDFPRVVLTNSTGFFDKIDVSSLKFVTGATVKVTNLTTGYQISMKEYSFKLPTGVGNDSVSITAYAPDFTQPYDSVIGRLMHQYRLDIVSNGQSYSAVTKIPNTSGFDSMWFEPYDPTKPLDPALALRVLYKDPDTPGNYNRYLTQILRANKKDYLDEEYLSTFSSVFDDKYTNGTRLPFYLSLGYSRRFSFLDTTQRKYLEEQQKIFPGDTVNIKWMPIDYNTYRFWQTFEYSRNSTGNPFAGPTKVFSNISNGAIGYWGGYGTKIITIIAPK